MPTERQLIAEARQRWKPFADVAEMAFDDPGEIYTAGFLDGARFVADLLSPVPTPEETTTDV